MSHVQGCLCGVAGAIGGGRGQGGHRKRGQTPRGDYVCIYDAPCATLALLRVCSREMRWMQDSGGGQITDGAW
jgi:hypothetical protein